MDSTSLIYRSHLSATEARKEFGLECTQVSLSLPSSSASSSSSHEEKWNKFVFQPATASWLREEEEGEEEELQASTNSQEQEQQQEHHQHYHQHHQHHHHHHQQQQHLIEFSDSIDTSQLNVKLADENRLLRLKIEILMDLVRR